MQSQLGASTLNDRESGQNMTQNEEMEASYHPTYGHIWKDVDGDYSSDDDAEENQDGAQLNKVRVIVRVRPLI